MDRGMSQLKSHDLRFDQLLATLLPSLWSMRIDFTSWTITVMAVGPVFSASRLLGVLPFDSNGKFDRLAYLYSSTFFIGLSAFVLFVKLERQKSFDVVTLLSICQYTSQIVSVFAHLYVSWIYRTPMREILLAVRNIKGPEYDLKLLTLGTLLCFAATYRSVLLKGFITKSALSGFGIMIFTYLNFLIVAQFCTIISRLNWSLEQLLIKIRLYKIDVGEHFDYMNMARTSNNIYSSQILVIFMQMFSYLVTYPYFAIREGLKEPASYYFTSHFVYLLLHVVIRVFMLFSITSTCHNAIASEKSLLRYSCVVQLLLNCSWIVTITMLIVEAKTPVMVFNLSLHVMTHLMNIFCVTAHIISMAKHRDFVRKTSASLDLYERGDKMKRLFMLGIFLTCGRAAPTMIFMIVTEQSVIKFIEEGLSAILNCVKLMLSLQFCLMLTIVKGKMRCFVSKLNASDIKIETHLKVVKLLQKINSVFEKQLLLNIIKIFLVIVSNGYWLYTGLIDKSYIQNGNWFFLLSNIFALLASFFEVFVIVTAAHDTSFEVESFNVELFRLMRDSKHLCENENLYLYATMKNGVTFTACGFFNLGYPLVTSIIAAAATYLVILIQFGSNPDSK
ncbi:hypothetical protein GE061_003826 [Apolygus lucorum]|uniref:Gustatory receptor n=1 Tax=Apolygus lucorum TaxID=248454 RepID=A0A6A4JEQ4_APOLU|nr:hypothetical protein GE061_003826 [Apolygus lucorum]